MPMLKKYFAYILAIVFGLSLWVPPAFAQIKITDSFKAKTNCPALESIRKGNNPGNIQVVRGNTYPVVGKNKTDASYYLLEIDGAQRWVGQQCGQLLSAVPGVSEPGANNGASKRDYVLALSWQPSFCETHQGKKECKTQTSSRFDATNLTLHGLFPEPNGNFYCGVSSENKQLDKDKRWSELPPVQLSAATTKALTEKMPGFASNLERHEWYKHGTCYGATPDEFFQDAILLQDQINNSDVQKLFAANVGKKITGEQIRASFDRSFGAGTGKKIAVECGKETPRLITELQINLVGEIKPDTSIKTLLASAKDKGGNSCPGGEVDRVGFKS
jgi:ribonuclease T2